MTAGYKFKFPQTANQNTLEHIQGHKIRCKNFMVYRYWNHTESILFSLWNYVRNQYQKIFENNPHILKCMWHQLCNVPDSTPIPFISEWQNQDIHLHESESRSVVSDPLWPHGLYGIIQVRILEWVAIPFSRGSSQPSNWTRASCITGGFFASWATREALHEGLHHCLSYCSCTWSCYFRGGWQIQVR